ncbi:MAG: Phosphoglycerate kinase [Berkelbacteria bacterium GW2011_GWA2_35_9]|uniref:Phosphoglycerate kinase n=1 Tax=Berkelbacteria bacterium GW2011_GWA2_35_9 TaxID=1618333 RepID=A0A0G0D4Y5_9BACT|nr:MAG: Phosphoglycerate kinase [Berkelbacteria bacterium GW2011_GWA2_35_9]
MISVKNASLLNKKVLLRVDWNVPLSEAGRIIDDFRIRKSIETIRFLIKSKKVSKIRVVSHLGRPKGKGFEKELSLKPIASRFKKLVNFEIKNIEILENIRFLAGEEKNSQNLAKKLALNMDVFVNDALSVCHRSHASVVGVTKILPSYAGLQLEKEVELLNMLLRKPHQPFIVIIGGAKVKDKSETIKALSKKASKILLGGMVANQILTSKNKQWLQNKKIYLPVDGILEDGKSVEIQKIPRSEINNIRDIGEETIERYLDYLSESRTVLIAGALGKFEDYRFAKGTEKIIQFLAKSKSISTFGAGGDTLEKINKMRLGDDFTYLFSGGSASLEYLSGKKLLGLEALK